MSKAVVFCGGFASHNPAFFSQINDDDYIICADSGIKYCNLLGLKANLWVGDFDSSDFSSCKALPAAENAEIICLNPVKDDTDTEFALDCAIKRGYTDIILFGGLGSRADHSFANVFLIEKYFRCGARVRIADDNNIIHFVSDSTLELKRNNMKYVSVLPLETITVSNEGFLYPLENEKMYRWSSRGISNELSGKIGYITVNGGAAIVIESKD